MDGVRHHRLFVHQPSTRNHQPVPLAPPFEFLARSFLPLIRRMGPSVDLELKRPGFFPAGGGLFHVRIQPVKRLSALDLSERGVIRGRRARVWLSKLPAAIAERELAVVRKALGWRADECGVELVSRPTGPGNALVLEVEAENVTGVFTGFGERGRPAEVVAQQATEAAKRWLEAEVPVDEHLTDQLLLPLALAGGGSFRTVAPSSHATTNATIIERFLPLAIRFEREDQLRWRATVGAR